MEAYITSLAMIGYALGKVEQVVNETTRDITIPSNEAKYREIIQRLDIIKELITARVDMPS